MNIEIYVRPGCGFCKAAKALLKKKKVEYTEYDIWDDLKIKDAMIERSNGAKTVPQIFIDDKHIGGYDDLAAFAAKGGLGADSEGGFFSKLLG